MVETAQQPPKKISTAAMKAIIFVVFIIGAICMIRFTPVKNYLTPEALDASDEDPSNHLAVIAALYDWCKRQ